MTSTHNPLNDPITNRVQCGNSRSSKQAGDCRGNRVDWDMNARLIPKCIQKEQKCCTDNDLYNALPYESDRS